jgi:hypothetical protein
MPLSHLVPLSINLRLAKTRHRFYVYKSTLCGKVRIFKTIRGQYTLVHVYDCFETDVDVFQNGLKTNFGVNQIKVPSKEYMTLEGGEGTTQCHQMLHGKERVSQCVRVHFFLMNHVSGRFRKELL